ncbi:MAG: response regulator transcription factor [Polyangiaceae bacterium]|nr:response regulator transcription factor [Polyangiaceae bacterium]
MTRDTLNDARPTILFVDEDDQLRTSVAVLLEASADVRPAGTAGEAFALLASTTFDVAVVDAQLGEGSGLALLEDLARTAPRTLRVLAVEERPSALDDLTASGVVQLQMAKPFGTEELYALLEEVKRRS